MNSYEDDDITNEVDLVVSAYPVQDDGLDEELLAAGNVPHPQDTSSQPNVEAATIDSNLPSLP